MNYYCSIFLMVNLGLLLPGSKFGDKAEEMGKRFAGLMEDYGHCIGNETWKTVLDIGE